MCIDSCKAVCQLLYVYVLFLNGKTRKDIGLDKTKKKQKKNHTDIFNICSLVGGDD